MEVKVSIAVPAYEHFDRGVEFLDDLFRTISIQTLKEVEVVVSDHSTEDNVEKFCDLNEYTLRPYPIPEMLTIIECSSDRHFRDFGYVLASIFEPPCEQEIGRAHV